MFYDCIDDTIAELIRDDLNIFFLVTKHGGNCTVEYYAPGIVEDVPTAAARCGVNHICSLSTVILEEIIKLIF